MLQKLTDALGAPHQPTQPRKQVVITLIDALALGWFFGVVSMFVALFGQE